MFQIYLIFIYVYNSETTRLDPGTNFLFEKMKVYVSVFSSSVRLFENKVSQTIGLHGQICRCLVCEGTTHADDALSKSSALWWKKNRPPFATNTFIS